LRRLLFLLRLGFTSNGRGSSVARLFSSFISEGHCEKGMEGSVFLATSVLVVGVGLGVEDIEGKSDSVGSAFDDERSGE
jgi:hypothetical protein